MYILIALEFSGVLATFITLSDTKLQFILLFSNRYVFKHILLLVIERTQTIPPIRLAAIQ